MKTLLLFVTVILFSVGASAQFQFRYATDQYEWPSALDMDNENGYIISGRTLISSWYPWLVRTDKSGTLLWSYTYDLPSIDEHFLDVTDTYWSEKALFATVGQADGDPALGTGMDDYFLMVDGSGMPVAARRFLTSGADLARHIEPIEHYKFGAGYVITGFSILDQTWEQDIHVVITDKNGDMMNSAVYLHRNAQSPRWIEPTKDGGFVLTGETVLPKSCDNEKVTIFVLRLDADLNVLWNRTFDLIPPGGYSEDRAYVIKETDDGDLHLSGTSRIFVNSAYDHSEPFQLHMKSDGSPVWLKAYQVESYKDTEAVSMLDTRLDDGSIGYVLSGRSYSPFDALLFKTDQNGSVLWGRTYPPSISTGSTFAEDVTDNKLKGYSFVGRTFNSAPSTAYDIHIMEGDANGKSDQPCEKEVKISEKEWRLCEDRLDLQETVRMRQIKIEPKVERLPLKAYKCTELATSGLQRSGTLSPNPAGTSVEVLGFEGTGEVLIYDLQGVLRKKVTQSLTTEINVADLPTGLYIVKVKDASGTIHEFRFVKE